RLAEELRRLPDGERERLRRGWRPDDGAVLEAAADLDGAALGQVHGAVAQALGRPAALTVQAAPALPGRAPPRVGGWVWAASLAGQLEAVRRGVPDKEEESCPTSPNA